jgi:enoyl-CoA hydratase/carnithine racemase
MDESSILRVESENGAAVLTLNRPEVMNSSEFFALERVEGRKSRISGSMR